MVEQNRPFSPGLTFSLQAVSLSLFFLIFFKVFFIWTIFKAFIGFFTMLFLLIMFWFLGHKACGNLSCPTSNWNYTLQTGRWSLNHWTARGSPNSYFLEKLVVYTYSIYLPLNSLIRASQVALMVKNPPANAGDIRDVGSILGWERSPGEGNGNPLQYSCLENSGTEKPGGLQSMGSQRTAHDWNDLPCTYSLINTC